jgi:hypothetical protein
MCTEASTVLRVVGADSDNRIQHVPMCVHYHEESGLEAF